MTTELALFESTSLAPPRGDTHPINAYLNGLSEGSLVGQTSAIVAAYAAMRGERLESLSPEVREEYRDAIWRFPWQSLRHEHVAALRTRLQSLYAPATANKYLSVVRSLLKSCWRLGLIDHDTMARACDVKAIKGKSPPVGRDITYDECLLLMRACAQDASPTGVRDAALFAIGWGCAPRIREVSNFDLEHYDADTGALMIRKGKGGKTRQVFASGGAKQALDDWIEIRGQEPGALFLPIQKGGAIQHVRSNGKGPEPARMSTWAISKRLERRREQASLDHLTWHDYRRSLAGDLIDDGDLAGAQLVLGHSSPAVTMRYSRRDLRIVEDVLSKRRTPYIRATGQNPTDQEGPGAT